MTTSLRLALVGFTLAFSVAIPDCLASEREPCFEDFPSESIYTGRGAAIRLRPQENDSWPDSDPKFRESVQTQAKLGVNFAGKYSIAVRTCGTGCSTFVLLRLDTGYLYRKMPFGTITTESSSAMVQKLGGYRGLQFRSNSRLLIAEGCIDCVDAKQEGQLLRLYLVWEGDHFREVKQIALPK